MADQHTRSSPPVALRIVRPFRDEAELLAAEANAFTRTGVVLIGAPSRPNGVVLRFEIVLKDGTAVMRGEGRVVGYKAPSGQDEGALMLRFTRLDVKSKSLLDRAVAVSAERRSMPPPAPAAAAAPPTPPPAPPRAPARVSAPPAPLRSNPPAFSPSRFPASPSGRPSSPAIPIAPEDDDEREAQEVDDTDLAAADESDLTEQAPPVASQEDLYADLDSSSASMPSIDVDIDVSPPAPAVAAAPMPAVAPTPPPRSKPSSLPPPPPVAAAPPAPSAPPPPPARIEVPVHVAPPRPELSARTSSLDPEARNAALDRLRGRAKKLAQERS